MICSLVLMYTLSFPLTKKWSLMENGLSYITIVHFEDETGTPYLKNLLFYVAPITNHIPRPRKRANQANTGAIYADSQKRKVLKPRPNYEPNYHYNYKNTYGANKNGNHYFNNNGHYGNTKQTYTYVRGAKRPWSFLSLMPFICNSVYWCYPILSLFGFSYYIF